MDRPKIALCLFGISSKKSYKHFNKNLYEIDYSLSVENYNKFIFNYFSGKGYDTDVFLSTYLSNNKSKLLEDYKPKQYNFQENWIRSRVYSRNKHFIKAIESCLEYSKNNDIKYDYVLITRFDLHFNDNFDNFDLFNDNLNLVSVLEKPDYIDDNFYFLPFSKLEALLQISLANYKKMFHFIKDELEQVFDINYIKNEFKEVQNLSFYKIIRREYINKKNSAIQPKKINANSSIRRLILRKKNNFLK